MTSIAGPKKDPRRPPVDQIPQPCCFSKKPLVENSNMKKNCIQYGNYSIGFAGFKGESRALWLKKNHNGIKTRRAKYIWKVNKIVVIILWKEFYKRTCKTWINVNVVFPKEIWTKCLQWFRPLKLNSVRARTRLRSNFFSTKARLNMQIVCECVCVDFTVSHAFTKSKTNPPIEEFGRVKILWS